MAFQVPSKPGERSKIYLIFVVGCGGTRDLLVDPKNASSGYDFSPLITALQKIVSLGYLPHIVTGNIPISMSSSPVVGGFGSNISPPANYSVYYSYIYSLASEIAVAFGGANNIQQWRWGVFTEFNNQDWFVNDPSAFFSIYETTVKALQDALGRENLIVGTHACTQCVFLSMNTSTPAWDPILLLQSVAKVISLYLQLSYLNIFT